MAETNNCTLVGANCDNKCGNCGWNAKVTEARNAEIATNGLTRCSDGLRRLIIRKEVPTDDCNT